MIHLQNGIDMLCKYQVGSRELPVSGIEHPLGGMKYPVDWISRRWNGVSSRWSAQYLIGEGACFFVLVVHFLGKNNMEKKKVFRKNTEKNNFGGLEIFLSNLYWWMPSFIGVFEVQPCVDYLASELK